MSATDAASQAELPWEHAATEVSGCRVCPTPTPVLDGSSGHTCERCIQVEELPRFVEELWEEENRLSSIRESEKEIVYWNRTLPSLGQTCQADRTHDVEDSLSSLHVAECGDLRDRGEW